MMAWIGWGHEFAAANAYHILMINVHDHEI